MKIALRGTGSESLVRTLEETGAAHLVGGTHNGLFFDAEWPSQTLDEFLYVASRYGSFDLNPWMTFTRGDIEAAQFLRVRPRKVVEDNDNDYDTTRSHIDALPWIGDGPMFRCRIPERVYLSRIRLNSDQLAVVGQWTAEFVVPDAVRKLIEGAGLLGADFRPVFDTRSGTQHDGYWHLYSNHLLDTRIIDLATRKIESRHVEEQGYDALGCFCYETAALEKALDFNRTGEGNVSFEFPEWVVSARVRELFAANRLKGWAFEPALEPATAAWEEYQQLWRSFRDMLAACDKHTIRGQQWPAVS